MFELLIFSENLWEDGLALSLGRDEGFPGGSVVKNLAASARDIGDVGLIPVLGRRKWQSTPVFSPGESHGQRSLVDRGAHELPESDMTEPT